MHLGHQDEKHTVKGWLKLFFLLAVDLVGLILECFPLSVGCESRAQGEGVGWHAQVALRYVFFFLSEFHTSAALLQKGQNSPVTLVTGKLKRSCWEPAGQEHCDKHPPPSPDWALADHLHRNTPVKDSIPTWNSRDFTTLLSKSPSQYFWDLFSFRRIFAFSLLALINNLVFRQYYSLWFIHEEQNLFKLPGAAGWEGKVSALSCALSSTVWNGSAMLRHCHCHPLICFPWDQAAESPHPRAAAETQEGREWLWRSRTLPWGSSLVLH